MGHRWKKRQSQPKFKPFPRHLPFAAHLGFWGKGCPQHHDCCQPGLQKKVGGGWKAGERSLEDGPRVPLSSVGRKMWQIEWPPAAYVRTAFAENAGLSFQTSLSSITKVSDLALCISPAAQTLAWLPHGHSRGSTLLTRTDIQDLPQSSTISFYKLVFFQGPHELPSAGPLHSTSLSFFTWNALSWPSLFKSKLCPMLWKAFWHLSSPPWSISSHPFPSTLCSI